MFLIFLIFCIFTDKSHTLQGNKNPTTPEVSTVTPVPIDVKSLPEPFATLLRPEGFLVSIPGKYDLRYFQFYGSINKPFTDSTPAVNSCDIFAEIWDKNPVTENWVYEDRSIKLQPDDTVYYWLFIVMKDNKCFWLHDRSSTATVSDNERDFRMIDNPPPTTSDYYNIYQRVRSR